MNVLVGDKSVALELGCQPFRENDLASMALSALWMV